MYDRTGNYLIVAILIGMILGVIVVAIFGESAVHVKFLGDIFLNALRMVVIPLLFCSMIVGITNLGDVRKLGRTGAKTILYFLVTSSISVIIGLILVNAVMPGSGFGMSGAELPASVQSRESYSFFGWLVDQIPSNIIGAAAETQVLPIIVFALFFGAVLTTIGSKGRPVIAIFDGLNDAIMKIVHIIMWFAPIGIFGLVAGQLAAQGGMAEFTRVLSGLGKYALVVIAGLLIHAIIILPLILKFVAGKNPLEYFVGMSQALMTAAATASSSATLPVTMECAEEKNDIDKRSTSFVLPLGATINMDGTALYEAVAAMFIAQAWGIDLNIIQQVTIFATAVLASIGAAGIPEAGLVTMVLVLQAVGLPLEGIGLILAIDWFLDRCRTTVNVWGDSIGAAVIATTAEIGLVDRRKKKTRREEAAPRPRFSGFKRHRKERDDRRGAGDTSRETGKPAAARKGDNSAKGKPRRQPRRPRRKDRSRDRGDRKDQRPVKAAPPAMREEYKPSGKSPDDRITKNDRKPPVAAEAPEKQTPSSDVQKQVYGRRRRRPHYSGSKSREPGSNGHPGSDAGGTKTSGQSGSGETSKYDVPKFPDKMLDKLTSAESDGDSVGKITVTDRADLYAYGVQQKEAGAADHGVSEETSQQQPEPDAKPVAGDADRTGGQAPESSNEDFSRLDEAVLGTPRERTGPPADESSEPVEPDSGTADDDNAVPAASPPADTEPQISTPSSESVEREPSDEDSARSESTEKPDRPTAVSETFDGESGGGTGVEPDEEKPASGQPPNEDSNDISGNGDESDEDNGDRGMWGRAKQKKSSR